MSKREREAALMRRLLAIAVHRLGGEMRVSPEELKANWELGMDSLASPTVVTGFKGE